MFRLLSWLETHKSTTHHILVFLLGKCSLTWTIPSFTLTKRAQEMGTNLDGCPDEIVEQQAMFNYTSANKANKKRIKKLQKQID